MYRISQSGQEPIIDVDSAEGIEPAIRSNVPSRYHVNEIIRGPLPCGHTSRRWGVGTKLQDRRMKLKPDPWES